MTTAYQIIFDRLMVREMPKNFSNIFYSSFTFSLQINMFLNEQNHTTRIKVTQRPKYMNNLTYMNNSNQLYKHNCASLFTGCVVSHLSMASTTKMSPTESTVCESEKYSYSTLPIYILYLSHITSYLT